MILECPNCDTRYEIPVELPPEGRKVRCAACQHIWVATQPEEEPEKPENEAAQPDMSALESFEDEEIVFKEGDPSARDEQPSEGLVAPDPVEEPAEPDNAAAGISDREFEDAFASAMEEAADDGDGSDADMDDAVEEPESPPIVIGKARKKRRVSVPTNIAAGWAALAVVLAGVTSVAYFQRVNVVRVLPGAASAYERIGLPVNVRGLEFEGVKYSWESSAGRPVLEVYGDITNITSKPLKVPTVVFGLRTKEKVEVYQWAADVRSELLPPGEKTAFTAQIPSPPKSIRDVQVRFAKVR